MTKVSSHLLCIYSDKSAEFGMLKRKVRESVSILSPLLLLVRTSLTRQSCLLQAQVLREYLQEPLQQVI